MLNKSMIKNNKGGYLYKLSYNYNNNLNNSQAAVWSGSNRQQGNELKKRIVPNVIINYYLKEYNNKGTKLQRINKINSWDNQLYKFNKKNEINTWIIDRLVSNLLIKIFKLNVNNTVKNIYINKPKFKHTLNKVYINFNYILGISSNNINIEKNNISKYYTSIITDINNILLNNNNNNLINYLSKLYNKEVIIQANNLKYHYNDNIILNKTIINNMEKYKGGLSGKYSKVLRTNIPMNNSLWIKNQYISNLVNNNYIKYNNPGTGLTRVKPVSGNLNSPFIKNPQAAIGSGLNRPQGNLNIANIYNSLNLNKVSKDLLINKYLIGLNILYKGKNLNTAGVSRSIKDRLLLGSLSNKLHGKYTNFIPALKNNTNNNGINLNLFINKSYKLNYIPNHHNIITNHKVNKVKTGTFGITTKLNTI